MKYTLKEWQSLRKSSDELIVQASSMDGSDGWQPFPIGMSHSFYHVSKDLDICQLGSHDKPITCSIVCTTDQARRWNSHINRYKILETLATNGIQNIMYNERDYYISLPQYKFVISPEGNGIDCHRHYEALMAGCIPIMEYNEEISQKYKGCPILFTKDYSEITIDYLNQYYESVINEVFDFSCLFLSTYSEDLRNRIKEQGNHWMVYTGKGKWYT